MTERLHRTTAGHAPARPPKSIRRTTTIDVSWPEGRGQPAHFIGRARDATTIDPHAAPVAIVEASFSATLTPDRKILAIETNPARAALSRLIGERAGGGLRKILKDLAPEDYDAGAPLYLLLDDLSGTSLVSGWAWSQWDPDWIETLRRASEDSILAKAFPNREGICAGFAPGSSGLSPDTDRSGAPAPDLLNPADPDGWHIYPQQHGVGMRRARRIDLRRDGQIIRIDSAFQDSATTPQGARAVVHEYSLSLTAHAASRIILSIEAQPRVLPFVECPNAADNVSRLVGTTTNHLRETVLDSLRGTAGCTHLNDALRALADAPHLLNLITQEN